MPAASDRRCELIQTINENLTLGPGAYLAGRSVRIARAGAAVPSLVQRAPAHNVALWRPGGGLSHTVNSAFSYSPRLRSC